MANYTWVNVPPVSKVNLDDFRGLLGAFSRNLESYGDNRSGPYSAANLVGAREVVVAMDGCLEDEDAQHSSFFAYLMDGQPIALMIMSGSMSPKVDELVGHPGADGAGTIMVEHAVNVSESKGKGGKVVLDSLDANSTRFWTSMGFVKNGELPNQQGGGGCRMKLEPSENDKWTKLGNIWRLARYADLSRFSTTV